MSESAIAQAAAHAELQHEGWEEVDFGTVKSFPSWNVGSSGIPFSAEVHLSSYDGSWKKTEGEDLTDDAVARWIEPAQAIVAKWPPKIEAAFRKWREIPQEMDLFGETYGLDHATRELSLAPDEDASGAPELSNVRLAADLDNLRTRTGQLNGRYATAFRENYVASLQPTMANQGALVALLALAAHTQASLWGKTSVDLLYIEQKAEAAMKASAPSGGGDSEGLLAALTVVGALASGVAAVATAGGSLALTATLVSAGAGGAGAILGLGGEEPSPKEVPLKGDDPDEVFANLEEALDELDRQIEGQEQDLVTLLDAGHGLTTVDPPHSRLRLRPSGISDAAPGKVLDDEQLITVDPQTIAKITELWLPSIAADLRSARDEMDAKVTPWHRPAGIGLEPTGAWPQFNSLQGALAGIIGSTADELDGAAASLQRAADGIGLSDEQANRRFDRKADRISELDL